VDDFWIQLALCSALRIYTIPVITSSNVFRISQRGHGERGERAYKWVWGKVGEIPAGSRGRALSQRVNTHERSIKAGNLPTF